MRICMAAPYDVTDAKSWSGTPRSVYQTLRAIPQNQVTALDLSAFHTPGAIRRSRLQYLAPIASLKAHAAVSRLGTAYMNPLNSSILRAHCSRAEYDVLLEFGGFMPSADLPPYYIYTDSSHDLSLDFYEQTGRLPYNYRAEDLDDVRRAAAHCRAIYQNAQGVFCMSRWLADTMIRRTQVDEKNVHVVYAGANWHGERPDKNMQPRALRTDGEIRLLLVGVSYGGKGVDLALDALDILNAARDGTRYSLHVCGLREEFPNREGVTQHGFISKQMLRQLLQTCDLFVLPSRFDCFGIAFVEAMTYGLPCVGRNLCAMPEIIGEGVSGELVGSDDPAELAEKIRRICGSAETYARYSAAALEKSKQFTWEKTTQEMMRIFRQDGIMA